MDTRTKIISAERAADLAKSGAFLVSGSFDPLTAALAEQLDSLRRQSAPAGLPLIVLIRSAKNPILPARARAELVAALSVVDYVCDAPIGLDPHVRLEQEHAVRLRELIARVHARQSSAGRDGSGNSSSQPR